MYPVTCKQETNWHRHAINVSTPECNANQEPRVGYEMSGQANASLEFLVCVQARLLPKNGNYLNCIIPGFVMKDAWNRTLQKWSGSADF